MMVAVKLCAIGDEMGVVLPKSLLDRMRAGVGDALCLTEAPDGLRITGCDPDRMIQMDAAQSVIARRRDVLRKLAR